MSISGIQSFVVHGPVNIVGGNQTNSGECLSTSAYQSRLMAGFSR